MNQTIDQTTPDDTSLGRRRTPREAPPHSHCFTLEYGDGIVIGALLDYTPDGLGLETNEPLEVGQQVTLIGNVEVDGIWKKVQGKAFVVRCQPKGEACYMLGLSGNDWGWRNTIDPNRPVLQRPAHYSSG